MSSRKHLVAVLVAACSLLLHPGQPFAQWAVNGTPLWTSPAFQRDPQIASDGAGGGIVVWSDARNGINMVVHAERLLPSGRTAPGWPVGGMSVARNPGHGVAPVLVPDGVGGAIIAWYNSDPLGFHIYAQRVTRDGQVAAGWPEGGLRLSDASGNEFIPFIISDGEGGAIVTWYDYRGSSGDIYSQRVTRDGVVSPGWPANGVLVCGAPGEQAFPKAVSDGAGGVIVVWQDMRVEVRGDIYAQHVTASGTIAEGWPQEGLPIAVGWDASYPFDLPVIATDGAGGAIIAWQDTRVFENTGVHVLRITGDGSIPKGWPGDGVLVGRPSFAPRLYPGIISDGKGGAFITYVGNSTLETSNDICVQHLTEYGQVAPSWPSTGVGLCIHEKNQHQPVIAPDGAGGGVVAWMDNRNGGYYPDSDPDIYAQRFTADGQIAPGWPLDGVAVCTVPGDQVGVAICGDRAEGAIVTWEDRRGGNAPAAYAARILKRGFVPPLVSIDVRPGHPDNIINAGSRGNVSVAILGSASFDATTVRPADVTFSGASAVVKGEGEPHGNYRDVSGDRLPDLLLRFQTDQLILGPQDSIGTLRGETWDGIVIEGSDRVVVVQRPSAEEDEESVGRLPAQTHLKGGPELAMTPNPSLGSDLTVSFVLSSNEPAALEALDVSGRSLVSRDVGTLGPGRHAIDLSAGRTLPCGIYWIRLTQGSEAHFARGVILR